MATTKTKVTLPLSRLRRLLTAVLPFAASSAAKTPVLAAVHLRTAQTDSGLYLVAEASDRFTFGTQRLLVHPDTGTRVTGDLGSVLLTVAQVRKTLALLKPLRGAPATAELTVHPDRVVVAADQLAGGVDHLALTFARVTEEYPLLGALLGRSWDHAVTPEAMLLDPRLVARFALAAAQQGPASGRMTWWGGAKNVGLELPGSGPVMVKIGDDFVGMVMPVVETTDPASRADTGRGSWAEIAR